MNTLPLVLAGGIGKRFTPLSTDKSLFPFMGQSLISFTLIQLKQVGFDEVLVVTNPVNHSEISSIRIPGLKIHAHIQSRPSGMADAILAVEDKLGDRPIFILNAGTLVEAGLYTSLKSFFDSPTPAIVSTVPPVYFPGGYLKIEHGRVMAIVEKPGEGKQPSPFLVQVFYYIPQSKGIISHLKTARSLHDDVFEIAYSAYLKENTVETVEYKGKLASFKYPWHVLEVMSFLLDQKYSDSVYVHPTARIMDQVILKGPCYIGPDVVVGDRSTIRQSIIESGAVIGSNSEVVRSYIGANCDLHGAYCGDSVLENHVHLAYGSVLANLRLDHRPIKVRVAGLEPVDTHLTKLGAIVGKDTEIGVNTSVMPGTMISPRSKITPHTIIKGYL